MKQITCYLDFISPFAYLAFDKLPQALMGHSYSVTYKPILFAALLKHHGQLGPAEIAPKREWTYRHVMWLAHSQGLDLQIPAAHPFNPLALLRLAIACQSQGMPNRHVCSTIFQHVWRGGEDACDAQRLQTLLQQLEPPRSPGSDEVKAQLKSNTDEAIAMGVFGVPTFEVEDKLFWGLDALPMLRAYLDDDAWFSEPHWASVSKVPNGASRLG